MAEKITTDNNIPWAEKYRPSITKEMVGFELVTKKLREFIDKFIQYQSSIKKLKKKIRSSSFPALSALEQKKLKLQLNSAKAKSAKFKARILLGPPGVGKTTVVYVLARDYNLSVIELNASDVRTEDALQTALHETVKSTNLLSFTSRKISGKLILIDEVDGIHGQSDRGGLKALEKIIPSSRYPIIMTCNFRDDRKFKALYQLASPLIEIKKASPVDIVKLLIRIAEQENISITPTQLKTIAKNAQGDYRSSINDLQALAQGLSSIDSDSLASIKMQRDSEVKVQSLLVNLFQTSTMLEAKKSLDGVLGKVIDFRNVHRWINENLLNYVSRKGDVQSAYHALAVADNILGYIGSTQDYSHLSYYFDILAGGIRFSKTDTKKSTKSIRPPRWFRLRAAPDDEIALRLQSMYHVSLNSVMREIRPSLQLFLQHDDASVPYLAKILNEEPKKIKKLFNL